jgi:trans-2,3-dihydro-3-hydroxyanthranilate isomerase
MRYRYYIVDVFTEQAFGGNQLAVLPEAAGLSDNLMQSVAREFNFSETTFVLPPQDPANTRQVRIFTPQREVPFAGHPNVGTAFALLAMGDVAAADGNTVQVLRFEEKAGLVAVAATLVDAKPVRTELTAPQLPQIGDALDSAAVARALALETTDIVSSAHAPCSASVGLPFVCVEVKDLDALARSRVVMDQAKQLVRQGSADAFLLYTRDSGDTNIDLRARMYAPLHGVAEDPATGSAAGALAGLLAGIDQRSDVTLQWRIAQGVEMGRHSLLEVTAVKENGKISAIRVAGASVLVSEGWIEVPND